MLMNSGYSRMELVRLHPLRWMSCTEEMATMHLAGRRGVAVGRYSTSRYAAGTERVLATEAEDANTLPMHEAAIWPCIEITEAATIAGHDDITTLTGYCLCYWLGSKCRSRSDAARKCCTDESLHKIPFRLN